jgi:hypothetical protein
VAEQIGMAGKETGHRKMTVLVTSPIQASFWVQPVNIEVYVTLKETSRWRKRSKTGSEDSGGGGRDPEPETGPPGNPV